jgi:NDP-sugar pyrophosphorylase family protein
MKAMILAAGLGTRLRPLTNDKPKALVEINGEPILGILIKRLIKSGFDELIINVHHFAPQVIEFIERNQSFGNSITISDETDLLLDTGGGLKKAGWFFDDDKPFLVYNADILSDMNLHQLVASHKVSGALATLVVRERESSRYFLLDDGMQLCGWENRKTKERKISRQQASSLNSYAFSGIHVISPEIFKHISEIGVFSIVDLYLRLASEHKILAYPENDSLWIDMGKMQGLEEAARILKQKSE